MPISAIILAAGQSQRFGPENKLLADWRGTPLIRHVVGTVLAAKPAGVLVVTGFDHVRIASALSDRSVQFVQNPDYAEGMSSSIRAGVEAAKSANGYLIVPGDMPWLNPESIGRILEAGRDAGPQAIVVPCCGARRGNPVLFMAAYRGELLRLNGDTGAREVCMRHSDRIHFVEVNARELEDLDEPL